MTGFFAAQSHTHNKQLLGAVAAADNISRVATFTPVLTSVTSDEL